MVILDRTAPEYAEHTAAVVAELEAAVDVGVKAAHALAGTVAAQLADERSINCAQEGASNENPAAVDGQTRPSDRQTTRGCETSP
jgi:hypothetical protein